MEELAVAAAISSDRIETYFRDNPLELGSIS